MGITIDLNPTWWKNVPDLKKKFAKKLNLLKKCSFLKRKSRVDLYFKVILSPLWHKAALPSGETVHCRAGRLIFNLSRDIPSETVMEVTHCDSIYDMYKLSLIKLFYNIVGDNRPPLINDLAVRRNSSYNPRGHNKAVVPRFSTYFMKNSIRYRGPVLWNISDYFNDSCNF